MPGEVVTLDERESQADDKPERYPFLIRVYGVLSIVGSLIQVNLAILVALAFVRGEIDLSPLDGITATTLVIGVVALILSLVVAIMFIVLGVRLLLGKRHRAATIANAMIAVEVAFGLCVVLLYGLGERLVPTLVNIVILIVLQTYSDPALRDERRLQRKLQQLERKAEAEDGTLGRDLTGKGYITLNFFNIFWVFVICCVLGLLVEIAYHMIVVEPGVYQDRAGLLYGPFSPIYGVGAVLMTIALNRFHDRNPLVVFLVSAVIGGAFEFFVSWFMETAFGITAWDYTGTFLSIGGRTNGMFMCMWGFLGLLWIKFVLPVMLKVVNKIPWNWRYGVTAVCATLMFVDAGLTLAALDCWYQREAGTMNAENPSAIVEFCNDNYGDDFMANRFQSMTIDADRAARAD